MTRIQRNSVGWVILCLLFASVSDAQAPERPADRALNRAVTKLASSRFGVRQAAHSRLVEAGSGAIDVVESTAASGDLDLAERCITVLAEIAKEEKDRDAALASLDRLAERSEFVAADLAKKLVFDLRETPRERAIRLLKAGGVRLYRNRSDDSVRSVSGVARDRLVAHLQHLPSLTTVNLSGPNVTNRSIGYLANVPQLQSLTMMRCSVNDQGLRKLPALKGLQRVSLSGDFTAFGLASLTKIGGLRSVSIFSSVGEDEIDVLSRLKVTSLYLSDVEATDTIVDSLRRMTNLRSLSLTLRNTDDDKLQWVKDSKIAMLNLTIDQSPKVTDAGLVHLSTPGLKSLQLRDTGITAKGLSAIGEMKELRSLAIQGTPLTDDDLKPLTKLQSLISLSLLRTDVTKGGVEELKDSMPKLQFVINDQGVVVKPKPAPKKEPAKKEAPAEKAKPVEKGKEAPAEKADAVKEQQPAESSGETPG